MSTTLTIAPTEHLTVRSSTPELLELEATFLPSDHRPPLHWHPDQEEHFEVLEGSVWCKVGDIERRLAEGETVDIPHRTPHQFWNPDRQTARVLWQVRPGGRTEQWFASVDALHRAGRVGSTGMPGPLAYAVLLTEFRDVFRLATPAEPLIRVVLAALAPIGRLRGYRPAKI